MANSLEMTTHPDEDTITAFVEARLAPEESSPLISHLILCSVCRSMTAQLVRLETELNEADDSTSLEDHPNRLTAFLDGIASRLIPSTEEEVFAYQNPDEKQASLSETDPNENPEDKPQS